MGLAKKGSRLIDVEGRRYRWVVSPDSGFMVIVVEAEPESGQRLELQVSYRDRAEGGQAAQLTPAVVRRAVLLALEEGWKPGSKGPAFRLPDADARVWDDEA